MIQVCVRYILSKIEYMGFLVMPFYTQWFLCCNFIHVYFIKNFNEKICLNIILMNQFQINLLLIFIIKKFKNCIMFIINPIKSTMVSKSNLIYFLVFWSKFVSISTSFWFVNFFCILYHVYTLEQFKWP